MNIQFKTRDKKIESIKCVQSAAYSGKSMLYTLQPTPRNILDVWLAINKQEINVVVYKDGVTTNLYTKNSQRVWEVIARELARHIKDR